MIPTAQNSMLMWRQCYCIIGESCPKYHSCRDKSFSKCFVATKDVFLSRQKYACRDKTFIDKIFLSRQKDLFGRDKHAFVPIKVSLSRQKNILEAAPANDIIAVSELSSVHSPSQGSSSCGPLGPCGSSVTVRHRASRLTELL